MNPIRIERMRKILIEYKGCIRRTSIESGVSMPSIKRYAKDILDNKDNL